MNIYTNTKLFLMKKRITFFIAILIMTSSALFAQNLEFSIRYNLMESRYDVYALPDASNPSFFWGPSQISVVVPGTVEDIPFSVTSVTGGAWQDNSDVYAPAVTPSFDYHGVGSLGASTPLQAGVELLIFHFTISGANCVSGARLYINGSDPNSGADGMQGGDFANTIFGIGSSGGGEYYLGNYDNNGTNCDADGDGTNNDDDFDPLDPCVGFTAGNEDPTNPIWANADCDGDGVINVNEDTDATDPYDSCSLTLASVSQNATDTGDCDGDGVTNADEINGSDGDFSTFGDNTDQFDPCDYNLADQGTPGVVWNMADCDEDGNPNGSDPNLIVATAADDAGTATPEMAEFIDILGNDDFLGNLDPANLGTTAITQTGGTAMGTVMFDIDIGELTYTPTFGEASMTVTVVYQVCNTDPDPDVCATATVTITIGVADQDSDGDGVLDSDEAIDMTDPSDPCSLVLTSVSENATDMGDCDGDGVTNADEINGTDGDFSTPGDNTNPIDPCSLNLADVSQNATDMGDCDGDGVTNADEINGTDGNFFTSGDSTDPFDSCDYNEADQGTPDVAWNMADCDEDGNPNGSDLNPIVATATDDAGTATPEMAEFIDILGNDDFLGNLDPTNLGVTVITQTGGTAMGTVMFDIDIGELTYTPTVGESGMTVTIVYQVCNTNPNPDVCVTATVTIIIAVVDQDSDGDGVLDSDETTDMTDLNDPCSLVLASVSQNATDMGDCDGDGVTNADEINGTDGDFFTPGDNTDPLDPCELNLADVSQNATDMGDCDGDGVTNADEINGLDDDFFTPGDNTDWLNPCDYNEADQSTPDAAWNMADCDGDGNTNGSDLNPVVATGTDDEGTAIPNTVATIDILGNDDFLDNLDPANLGTTAIIQTGGTAMGTVMFDTDTGDLIYTPIFGESGMTVTVVYQVCNTDTNPDVCATATVTITVTDQDSDGDGVLDSEEITDMTDPSDPCSLVLASVSQNATDVGDCDGDGVTNADEINGTDGDFSTPGDNTDPINPCGLNPADVSQNATDMGDCDGDGVTNADEINGTDGDFFTPGDNTDPLDPCELNLADVSQNATDMGDCDGDGVTNADEINGLDDDFFTPGDNTDWLNPCDYNEADQSTPDAAWNMADCDEDGNPNGSDLNPVVATSTDDEGTAIPNTVAAINILGNDDFLDNLDPANLGTTAITQTGGTAMGTVMFDTDTGDLIYTSIFGESGMTVTVVYQVCNTDTDPDVCATATVTITVADQDSDGDGVLDSEEISDMTDPNDPCSLVLASVSQNATDVGDCDGDGVTNADEINGTDGDFSTPGDNTDPIDPCNLNLADVSQNATDMGDCDGDGVTNADEINGTDDDFSISDDNTDPLDPCDYNEADQITPDAAWNMADCDEDGNPNGSDFNPVVATGTDDEGTAIPNTVVAINILGNDDFLDNLDSENLGTTAITQTGGTAMGTVMFDTDTGDLIYTSIFGESGMTVTVVYQVCNTDPDPDVCATATVTITVADQDSDGDGVLDSDEATDLTDLNDPCSLVLASVSQNATDMGDCDGDGVTNADEINGTDGDFSTPGDNTDPLDPCELNLVDVSQNATDTGDCDGDGVTNADEINGTDDDFSTPDDNTDPLYPCDFNVVDVTLVATSVGDCDGDGVTNADEINGTDDDPSRLSDNTDPNDPCSSNHMDATVVATDTGDCDGDGISNNEEINGPDGDPNSGDDNNNPFDPCDPNSNSATCSAQLQVRVALQGSLFNSGSSLMRDDLRSGGFLPINEPYSALAGRFVHFGDGGREATTAAVLMANAGTSNAIVDWVFIELRDVTDPAIIVETRSALLQRDGDVVDATDGMSALTFFGVTGDRYHIAVKHRNHLGVMTAEGVIFTSVTVIDFTIATAADLYDLPGAFNYDGIEQITTASGIKALWAGNAIADNKMKHQGPNTDNTAILLRVLTDLDNTSSSYNFNNSTGYDLSDINMDGRTKYQGARNDASYIFLNLLFNYPLNTGGLYNYDFFVEQLP
jgi:hypothetical protein